jgi:hypothetical protein
MNTQQHQSTLQRQQEQQHMFGGGNSPQAAPTPTAQPPPPPNPNPTITTGDNSLAAQNATAQAAQKTAAATSAISLQGPVTAAPTDPTKKALLGG